MELFFNFSYRQAQAAVNIALPKLKKLDVATRRPDDYFAEMVKTDDHMQRVGVRQEIPSLHTSCSCEERGGWRGRVEREGEIASKTHIAWFLTEAIH